MSLFVIGFQVLNLLKYLGTSTKCASVSTVVFVPFRSCNTFRCVYNQPVTNISYNRHPDPRSRPQFGQITKLLAGNGSYLLGWSDDDKQVAGEYGMKLGAPLECSRDLYPDLQCTYS